MFKIIIEPNISIWKNNKINNIFDTYEDATSWVNKHFKFSKYIKIKILKN